jgi:hypothetical protein
VQLHSNPLLRKKGTDSPRESEGRLYSTVNGKNPVYKDYENNEKPLLLHPTTYIIETLSDDESIPIDHNLERASVFFTLQLDNNGSPGEYVLAKVFPTEGNETNSITITCAVPVKLHVTVG